MKINSGNIVTPIKSIKSIDIYDSCFGIQRNILGQLKTGEIAIVISLKDSASLEVKILAPNGIIGWIAGAWLKIVL